MRTTVNPDHITRLSPGAEKLMEIAGGLYEENKKLKEQGCVVPEPTLLDRIGYVLEQLHQRKGRGGR